MPSGDPMTRLNLAVESAGGARGFFLLKAWAGQSRLVSSLGAGARVGANGALLSERFDHRGLTRRSQVVVEVTASNIGGKRVGRGQGWLTSAFLFGSSWVSGSWVESSRIV